VGFNTVEANVHALQLLERMRDKPTLNDLEKEHLIRIRVYNPGQHKTKGFEEFCRKLFVGRYGARSPSVTLLFDKVVENNVRLRLRRAKKSITIPISATVPSLRTYSQVRHIDVTNEEEFAVINPNILPNDVLRLTDLLPPTNLSQATKDIKSAHDDLAGNFLLVRKIRLSSPELYWLTFYSKNKIIGTTSALLNMQVADIEKGKVLAVYLNSILSIIQLIAFMAETEGAWVTLHSEQVWAHIHVPDVKNLSNENFGKAQKLFAEIEKLNVKPLYQRIRTHDKIQKSIDELALEMVGLSDWKNRLNELYNAVAEELGTMQKILDTSKRTRQTRRKK